MVGFAAVLIATWELLFAYVNDCTRSILKNVSLNGFGRQQFAFHVDRWWDCRHLLGLYYYRHRQYLHLS